MKDDGVKLIFWEQEGYVFILFKDEGGGDFPWQRKTKGRERRRGICSLERKERTALLV